MMQRNNLNGVSSAVEVQRPRRTLRRIGAVLAGVIVGAGLALGTDGIMHATGVFPPWGQTMGNALFVLALAYRSLYNVVAAYVTAWLAPMRPMWHALAGGALNVLASIAGAVATWDKGPEFGPHWYPLALIALALPCAWLGGVLNDRRQAER